MNLLRFALMILGCLAACGFSYAQAAGQANAVTLSEPKPKRSRFGLSYRAGFNISARVKNLGRGMMSNPGPATGGVPHNYDDGFVRVDVSGNAGGQTWNWGYDNPSQVQEDQLVFSASNPGRISGANDGDPQNGFELTYSYEVGASKLRWGIESGFGYTDISIRNRAVPHNATLTVDSYSLGGITPPEAPYAGTFAGPGALISDTPTRLPVSVVSRIDASVYALRLGPYVEVPLCRRATVVLSGGPVIAITDSEFKYNETAPVSPGVNWSASARNSRTGILAGGYLAAALDVHITESLGANVGLQFESLGDYSQRAGDVQATLDLSKSLFMTAGLSYSF